MRFLFSYVCHRMVGAVGAQSTRPDPFTADIGGNMVLEFYAFNRSQRLPWLDTIKCLIISQSRASRHQANELIGQGPIETKVEPVTQLLIYPQSRITWGMLSEALEGMLSIVGHVAVEAMPWKWSFGLALTDGSDDALLAWGQLSDSTISS